MTSPVSGRRWEIDALRGLALLLMLCYHFCYDLHTFFDFNLVLGRGWLYFTGKTAAVLFILTAGISCTFSRNNPGRGLKLIAWGLVIFVVTNLAVPGSNIVFGILQFLGVSIIISPLLNQLPRPLLAAAGAVVILSGSWAAQFVVSSNWLIPLGFGRPDFASADYFPLIPWFGVFLLGMSVGGVARSWRVSPPTAPGVLPRALAAAGRHTLVLYLAHQPVILTVLYLILDPGELKQLLGGFLP